MYNHVYAAAMFIEYSQFEEIKKNKEKELEEVIKHFRANKAEIKRKRIEDGIQDKY